MITLVRGAEELQMKSLLWDAYQVFAKQAGWHPEGAIDRVDRRRHTAYAVGCLVSKRDAGRLAAALERFVNSEKSDSGELDLGGIVALVNFLRGGPFLIR
jgi:hypothetical protein